LWKHRDHGHFICFAPADKPRYACAVVIEHGGGSSAAYPIARDVMTYLFDPVKALEVLHGYEKDWGGNARERLEAKYRSYSATFGESAPKVPVEEQNVEQADTPQAPHQPFVRGAQSPAPEPVALPPEPPPSASPAPAIDIPPAGDE
jgi:penicillin-binding protein 2